MTAGTPGFGEDHGVRIQGPQGREQVDGIALTEHGKDRNQTLGSDEPAKGRTCLRHRGGIVAAIQDDPRLVCEDLERPGQRVERSPLRTSSSVTVSSRWAAATARAALAG